MKSCLISLLALAAAGAASGAESCEALRAEIEAKISAAGVQSFTVSTVAVDDPAEGQVVGSCERGSKKIVYRREGAPGTPTTARPRGGGDDQILTECKDGTVSVGGACRN